MGVGWNQSQQMGSTIEGDLCITPLGISTSLGLFCAWNGCMQSSTVAKSYTINSKM